MKISDMLHAAMLKYLHKLGVAAAEVTGYTEDTSYFGGCDTCSTIEYGVDIHYTTHGGRSKTHTYNGRFGDLIQALDRLTDEES